MGYYPIKCPTCTYVHTSWEEVLFDTTAGFPDMVAELKKGNRETAVQVAQNTQPSDVDWSEDAQHQEKTEALNRLATYEEIRKFCERNNVEPPVKLTKKINVTKDYQSAYGAHHGDDDELLTGVMFRMKKGEPVMTYNKRCCGNCNSPLPQNVGHMPTYVIPIMGTTYSGKTVFLCALYHKLTQSGVSFGDPGNGKSAYGGISCTAKSHKIEELSSGLFKDGKLPDTTTNVLNEPLVFQITYQVDSQTSKKCLLSITDMRGEDFGSTQYNLGKRIKYFQGADGFLVLVSPRDIGTITAHLPVPNRNQSRNAHEALQASIQEYILTNFEDDKINSTAVIMLSQVDLLFRYRENLKLDTSNAAIGSSQREFCNGSYFNSHDTGVNQILDSFDNKLKYFLNGAFSKTIYTSFSSLGAKAEIDYEKGIVTNPNSISSVRIRDPILLLLMEKGFLPDFRSMHPVYSRGSRTKARENRVNDKLIEKNKDIVEEWKKTHL